MKELYTERLILKEISIEDTDFIVDCRSKPEVYRYFLNPHCITKEEHINWFTNNYSSDDNRVDFIVKEKESQKSIGIFGIKYDSESKDLELNYLLMDEYQHKGYAKEALEAITSFGVNNYDCKRLIATVHEENKPSRKFIEDKGYKPLFKDGKFIYYGVNL